MAFWPQNLTHGKNPSDLEEVRGRYAAIFARLGTAPTAIDFTPGQLGPVPGEWVGATGTSPSRTLLYFHGGVLLQARPKPLARLWAGWSKQAA